MKQRVKELVEQGDRLFSTRGSLLSYWQRAAEHFYPERADFTTSTVLGEDFASHLLTGWPILMRRELANSFAAMLRPRGKKWFRARTDSEIVNNDPDSRAWLDAASDLQLRAMYARTSQFMRATKEGDNDFATFGQCVISREIVGTGLLYRCWHLRDCVWCENELQQIDTLHIKWNPTARELVRMFPKSVSERVKNLLAKEPYKTIQCRRIVMPTDDYDGTTASPGKKQHPFTSVYIDVDNETILEEVGLPLFPFTIPRWVTVSGSQYAYSPSTVVGLPDARLLQQITLTLLEAGQKAVDPPMKATHEAIIGGLNLQAGGVSWIDRDYDERNGPALEPAWPVSPRLDYGLERETRIQSLLQRAFFLDQIRLPDLSDRSTAYEVQKRVEEYIRYALPLFEPLESEYNSSVCEGTFEDMLIRGAFGSVQDMPEMLRGREIKFQFESPLQAASDRAKTESYVQAIQLLGMSVNFDPAHRHDLKIDTALRDALLASGVPATWVPDRDEAEALKEQDRQAAQAQQMMQELSAGSAAAGQAGEAVQQLQAGGVI